MSFHFLEFVLSEDRCERLKFSFHNVSVFCRYFLVTLGVFFSKLIPLKKVMEF